MQRVTHMTGHSFWASCLSHSCASRPPTPTLPVCICFACCMGSSELCWLPFWTSICMCVSYFWFVSLTVTPDLVGPWPHWDPTSHTFPASVTSQCSGLALVLCRIIPVVLSSPVGLRDHRSQPPLAGVSTLHMQCLQRWFCHRPVTEEMLWYGGQNLGLTTRFWVSDGHWKRSRKSQFEMFTSNSWHKGLDSFQSHQV